MTTLVFLSCSGEGSKTLEELIEEAFPYVTNNNKSLDIANFEDKGFKLLREYKSVEELPPLLSSYHGIFNKKDYELRFYENHDLALSNGADDAKIVTGKDGIVTGDVPWEDGEKDRRRCSRPPGQPHSGCNYTSKYGDFVIFNNVVVMCEGKDIMESRMTCSNLLGLLNVDE